MSCRLQLDVRNLNLGRRHLVNAYDVKVGIGVIAGNTVWSMPERLECEVLQKMSYINTLTFTFTSTFLYSSTTYTTGDGRMSMGSFGLRNTNNNNLYSTPVRGGPRRDCAKMFRTGY